MKIVSKLATAVAALTIATAAYAENPMVGGAPMFETKNIVENAVNSADHTTLVAAVQAASPLCLRERWIHSSNPKTRTCWSKS